MTDNEHGRDVDHWPKYSIALRDVQRLGWIGRSAEAERPGHFYAFGELDSEYPWVIEITLKGEEIKFTLVNRHAGGRIEYSRAGLLDLVGETPAQLDKRWSELWRQM